MLRRFRIQHWLPLLAFLVTLAGVIYYRHDLWGLLRNLPRLKATLLSFGPWAPLALIGLNTLQIVIAPIPSMALQVAGGYLFGTWVGWIYSMIASILGGLIDITLARLYGRPVVVRLAGATQLERWERVAHSDSTLVWILLMLSPLGDICFYLAGLTRVPPLKVILIAIVVRGPSTAFLAALGSGKLEMPLPLIITLVVLALILGSAGIFFKDQLQTWAETLSLRKQGNLPARKGDDTVV